MTTANLDRAVTVLRLALGVVVLQQSCFFVFTSGAAKAFARTGLPNGFRLLLGSAEIVAAVLFLVPWTVSFGAVALAAVFVVAASVHLLHGEFDIGGLVVYLAAVIAVLAHRNAAKVVRRAAT
jgi:hypothetical protein